MTDIKFDKRNYRIHDEKNKRIIRKSLEDCGAGRSVLVDKDNCLIAGNGVYEQAKDLGIPVKIVETDGTELVVVKRTDLSGDDEKRKTLALVDNHASDTSSFDMDMVVEDFSAEILENFEIDVSEIFDDKNQIPEDDGFGEPDESTVSTEIKNGDIFLIKHDGLVSKLRCGDTCKEEDVKSLLGEEKADMIFTDPPFDLEDRYSNNIFESASEDCHIFIMNSDKILIDNVNNGREWFRKFFAVDFRIARLVSNNQPMTRVDLIAEFCKGKTKFNNLRDGFSTLIECSKIHSDNQAVNFGHKQAKRIELPGTFIAHYSKQRDLIVDLFAGSGSTIVAAIKMGRRCYAQEFDPINCQIIIDRIKETFEDVEIIKV